MTASPHTLLATYLNDHFAAATAGVELCRRARSSNAGTELGELLARLAEEIAEDRATLEAVMDAAGVSRDPLKPRLAWTGEKLGRLKLNGQLRGQSPLSRVIELEGLVLGISGKQSLWSALEAIADPRLASFDFAALVERAQRQRSELEPQRLAAAREALSAGAPAP